MAPADGHNSRLGSVSSNATDPASDVKGGPYKGGPGHASAQASTFVRVLTVIAYIVSVSTAAALLSGYYIFFWVPQPSEPLQKQIRATDSPFSLSQNGNLGGGAYHHYGKNSVESTKHSSFPTRTKKSGHHRSTPSPNYYPKSHYSFK